MDYTFCEKLLWRVMIGPMERVASPSDPKAWRKETMRIYREIIASADDIGSLKENTLRASLSGGALWIAGWKATGGAMDEETFSWMVRECMSAKIVNDLQDKPGGMKE